MKHLRSFIPVLFLAFFVVSCSSPKDKIHLQKGKVIIAGQFISKNESNRLIYLKAGSEFALNYQNIISFCDSLGRFKFSFNIFKPQVIDLIYNQNNTQEFYKVFVKPKDSLFVIIDEEKGKTTVQVKGPTARVTSDIHNYSLFRKKHQIKMMPNSVNVSIKDYYKELAVLMHKSDSIVNEFTNYYHPSKEALKYIRHDTKYGFANNLIYYQMYHRMHKMPVDGKLFDKKVFPVDDDPAIVSGMYMLNLFEYADFHYSKDSVYKHLWKINRFQAYIYLLNKIISNERPGLSRDFMYYQMLSYTSNFSWGLFDSLMQSPKTYRGNKLMFGELQEKLINHQKAGGSGIVQLSEKGKDITGNFYENLTKRFHGKVIYLDFWMTSCGPCLAQVPYEIRLHKFLKNKQAVLVPVCLNSSKEDWLRMVKQMHIPGENYFLSGKQSQIISSALKIPGFPTYMIVDKNGKLVDRNAPLPQNAKKVKSVLMKYLKE